MAESSEKAAKKKRGPGRPFQPGQSGNPGGRAAGMSLTTRIKRLLEADNGEKAELLAAALIMQACKGNGGAIKEIFARIDGPVVQQVEVHGRHEHEHYFIKNCTRDELRELEAIVRRAESRGNPE